jgi:hypothetical protein
MVTGTLCQMGLKSNRGKPFKKYDRYSTTGRRLRESGNLM